MTHRLGPCVLLPGALLLCAAAPAGKPTPPISDAILNDSIDMGEEIAARVDGDLDGDGRTDTAYLVTSPDHRTLHVLLAPTNGRPPYRPVGTLALDMTPAEPTRLTIANRVLKVEDLSGGDTVIATTFRYRLNGIRMRLIGLDATLYDRASAREGYDLSWNLVTGALFTQGLQPNRRTRLYDRVGPSRSQRVSKPVFMEDTPDPEMVMIDIRKK